MPEYDIPLSDVYGEGKGKRVEIGLDSQLGPRFYVTDRRGGGGPDDVIGLSRSEVEELAHVCLAFLNRDTDGTLGYGSRSGMFETFRDDHDERIPETPDYVQFIGRGVNEYECQRCGRGWSGYQHEEAATHDCNPAELDPADIADDILDNKPEDAPERKVPLGAIDEVALPEWLPEDCDQETWDTMRERVREALQDRGYEVV